MLRAITLPPNAALVGDTTVAGSLRAVHADFAPGSNADAAIIADGAFGGGVLCKDGAGHVGMWADGGGTNLRFGIGTAAGLGEKLCATATGNVGIGTASPDVIGSPKQTRALHVLGALRAGGVGQGGNEDGLVQVGNFGSVSGANWSANALLAMNLVAHSTGSADMYLTPHTMTTGYSGVECFQGVVRVYTSSASTTAGADITPAEHLRIGPSGLLGLGTPGPLARLTVRAAATQCAVFGTTDFDANTGSALVVQFGATTGNVTALLQGTVNGWQTVGDVAINASGGNVGVGTAGPSAKLDVVGVIRSQTSFATGMVALGDTTANYNVGVFRGSAAGTADGNYLNLGGYDGVVMTTGNAVLGSQTERLRIDASGYIIPASLTDAADDAAAATASVPVGALYRNGSVLMVRVA